MSLAEHARRELELCGQYAEDPGYSESIIRAVEAFASYGHSGGSAMCAREQLHALLGFKPLSPLTGDPAEWVDHSDMSGTPLWQNKRDPSVFSTDGGKTMYSVEVSVMSEMSLEQRLMQVIDRFEHDLKYNYGRIAQLREEIRQALADDARESMGEAVEVVHIHADAGAHAGGEIS
jgi:hypothetical protein